DDGAVGDDAVVLRQLAPVTLDAHRFDLGAIDLFGEVGARDPGIAAIVGLEEPVAAEPDDARVVGREDVRRVPVEAIHIARTRIDDIGSAAPTEAATASTAAAATPWSATHCGAARPDTLGASGAKIVAIGVAVLRF